MSDRNFRKRVLREARNWIGTPYCHQASVRGQGADCLGLIRGVWRKLYGNEPQVLPNYSRDWGEVSSSETMLVAANRWFDPLDPDDARAGDLVVFRWHRSAIAKHAGILSGRTGFIHSYEKTGVVETTLGYHWQKRIVGTFRFPSIKQS